MNQVVALGLDLVGRIAERAFVAQEGVIPGRALFGLDTVLVAYLDDELTRIK